jgi:hypothetical protein
MEKNKGRVILIVLMTIIIVILLIFGINFISFRKKLKGYTEGHFELRDGVDTYVASGQVVRNSLVEVGDKLYFVDNEGHKVKDTWAIIDNDGNYGYFGSLGDLVKGKIREIDGKKYYFDEEGVLYIDKTSKNIKNIDGVDYIANANGELRLSTEQETTTVAPTKKQTQQTVAPSVSQTVPTQAGQVTPIYETQSQTTAAIYSAPFANAINITGGSIVEGPGAAIVATAAKETTVQTTGEVKIVRTEKIVDTVEGSDYDCTVTLLKPVLSGATAEETENINAAIDEITDAWFEDVAAVVEEYVTFPKSVTFTSATLGTVKKSSIIINVSGSIKQKSGSSKTIKYRITYDREETSAEIVRTSTN